MFPDVLKQTLPSASSERGVARPPRPHQLFPPLLVPSPFNRQIPELGRVQLTGFSSQIGTKLRDWAVGQAGAGQLLLSGSIVLK